MTILNDDDDDGNHDGDDNSDSEMMMRCRRNKLINTFSRRLDFVFINVIIKNVHIYCTYTSRMSHFSYMVFFISQNSSTT